MEYPGVAQMVARLNGVQEAAGSTPVTRTKRGTFRTGMLLFFIQKYAENQRPRAAQAASIRRPGGATRCVRARTISLAPPCKIESAAPGLYLVRQQDAADSFPVPVLFCKFFLTNLQESGII